MSFKFSISAPCPPGRKRIEPSAFLKGLLSGVAATVSVLGFCSESPMLNLQPVFFLYIGNFFRLK